MVAVRSRHAGPMVSLARFERRVPGDDGHGNALTDTWAPLFTAWAHLRPQFGREQVEAGRLESTLLAVLTIDRHAAAEALTAADRAVITAGPYAGLVLNLRSLVPTMDNRQIEITAEQGVAT